METSLNRGIEKYSVDFTGRALANFVNLAKVTYSNIGNYSSSVKGGKKDIVASGHQIFDMNDKNIMNSPVTIYTFTSRTIIDKSLVFQNEFGTKTSLILSNILDKTELEQQVKDELLQKLRDIDSKKCLVIPVRPQSDYKVSVEVNNQKKTKMPAKVRYIKWSTNKDNYKLDCVVGFDVDTGEGQKIISLPIGEYGRSFVPDKMEYWADINKSNINTLKFNSIGLIHPLELTDGMQSLVVDGTYLYWLHNGTTNIIGEWDYVNNTLIINDDAKKALARTDVFKYLKNNLTLLNGHKNLIMPFNLAQLNKINVKEKKK